MKLVFAWELHAIALVEVRTRPSPATTNFPLPQATPFREFVTEEFRLVQVTPSAELKIRPWSPTTMKPPLPYAIPLNAPPAPLGDQLVTSEELNIPSPTATNVPLPNATLR